MFAGIARKPNKIFGIFLFFLEINLLLMKLYREDNNIVCIREEAKNYNLTNLQNAPAAEVRLTERLTIYRDHPSVGMKHLQFVEISKIK